MQDNKLFLCPAIKEKGKQLNRVLDVGCGTGVWAIDFGMRTGTREVGRRLTSVLIIHQRMSIRKHTYAIWEFYHLLHLGHKLTSGFQVIGVDLSPIQPSL